MEEQTPIELKDDQLPEGATLVLDSSELTPEQTQGEGEPQKQITLTPDKFMDVLRKMLASDQITRRQMLEMRRRFGITNASFHKKKVDAAKKKRKRALAYRNRRANRLNNSTKGQKRNNGRA